MGEGIETEVRLLLRNLSDTATLRGGMDRLTHDLLLETAAMLRALDLGGRQEREDGLAAVRERLRLCEATGFARAA